jgi:pimeloyl-ACP methyl ester carboxylesterase
MQSVEFYSEGVALQGDLYIPKDAAGPAPAVVLCHGYTGTRSLYFPDVGRALARAGYVAFAFDYKGWGDSGGPRSRLDPYGRVADVRAALTYLGTRGEVDASRLALFGFSFGGSVACWVGAVDDRVGAIVSVVAVAHGQRWLKAVRTEAEWVQLEQASADDRARAVLEGESEFVDRPVILKLDPASLEISGMDRADNAAAVSAIPMDYVDETLAFNPEWVVEHVAPAAALFVCCAEDAVVPADESRRLHELAGEPKRLVVLECGHYDVYREPELGRVIEESIAWYGEHL